MTTLDANVYISALEFGGKPLRLLHAAIDGALRVAIAAAILHEVLRVLRRKFGRTDDELTVIENWIRSFTQWCTPSRSVSVVPDDPDDNRVVECAIASESTYIVTGDQDLLRLGVIEGIRIVRVAEYLDLIGSYEEKSGRE